MRNNSIGKIRRDVDDAVVRIAKTEKVLKVLIAANAVIAVAAGFIILHLL